MSIKSPSTSVDFQRLCLVSLCLIGMCLATTPLSAQVAGWSEVTGFEITEGSGTTLTAFQIPLTIDTATPIGLNQMQSGGEDIRFGMASDGTGGLLDYWIESGINTASTKIWIKIPSVAPSTITHFYGFWGNSTAPARSSIADTFEGPYSGNDQATGGNPGGSGDRQRGFHFTTSRDILVVATGKNEPTGTTRYLTMFDVDTSTLLTQNQVSGAAATYTYEALATPLWLPQNLAWDPDNDPEPTFGYLVTVFLATGDQYYIGSSTGAGPYLTYVRTRWCNTCTKDTLPTNKTTGHYGYPDFMYYARAEVPASEPSVAPISSDLVISIDDGLTTATPGTAVTYTITASNSGPSDAVGATVQDAFPGVLTCTSSCAPSAGASCSAGPIGGNINDTVNIPSAGSVTYTSMCTIDAGAVAAVANLAEVVSPPGSDDQVTGNNIDIDTDFLIPAADLMVTKDDGRTTVGEGQTLTYEIVVSNLGPSDLASGGVVTDTFPADLSNCEWTCSPGAGGICTPGPVAGHLSDSVAVAAGSELTYTATCTVAGTFGSDIVNTAGASGAGVSDPNLLNNSADDTTSIQAGIFADGFESGSTTIWTQTIGG